MYASIPKFLRCRPEVQLEAAIAGRSVITPYFDEALRPEYADFIQFENELHLFDVAHNSGELKSPVISRLDKLMIGQDCMREGYRASEKKVSSANGGPLEKYTRGIQSGRTGLHRERLPRNGTPHFKKKRPQALAA